MTLDTHNVLIEEDVLNQRCNAIARVLESLGAYQSTCASTIGPISSNRASSNVYSAQATNELIYDSLNHLPATDSMSPGNCGNKRNCQGDITLQRRLSTALSPVAQQRMKTAVLMKYLHRNDTDVLGGALIRIPAMQLENPDDEKATVSGLMPDLGSSHLQGHTSNEMDIEPKNDHHVARPEMKASMLHMLVNHAQNMESLENCEMFDDNNPSNLTVPLASVSSTNFEREASENLGRMMSFTRTSVQHAPLTLLQSLWSSFSSLIQHRTKSWTILLLRHSLSSGDQASRDRLMKLLAAQGDLELNSMATEFVVQDQPLHMKSQLWAEGLRRKEIRLSKMRENGHLNSSHNVQYCDLLLPFIFNVSIHVSFQGRMMNICFNAPGSAGAIFHESNDTITFLECDVDTDILVRSMVEQARMVVFQAVSRSTASTGQISHLKQITPTSTKSSTQSYSYSSGCGVGFSDRTEINKDESIMGPPMPLYRNAIDKEFSKDGTTKLSPYQIQSSILLREGGMSIPDSKHPFSYTDEPSSLSNQTGSFQVKKGLLKERSVQWDTGVKPSVYSDTQESKRLRQGGPIISRMVRSSKSFGRPGPDVFQNSRNATFSEFGHVFKSSPLKLTERSPYHIDRNLLQRNNPSLREWNQGSSHDGASDVAALERTPTQLENFFLSSQLSQMYHGTK